MPDDPVNVIQTTNNIHKAMQGPSIELYYEVPVRACLQSLFPQMFSFNQQTFQLSSRYGQLSDTHIR